MRLRILAWLADQGWPGWWIPSYWFLLVCAIVVGSLWTVRRWRRAGQDPAIVSNLLFFGIPGLFVGAVLFYSFQFGFTADRWRLQGMSLYGGLAGLLAVWAAAYAWKPYRLALFLDCVTPPLAFGVFLVRIGCFLHGCNGGIASSLPWAVAFPPGSPVYSTQVARGLIEAGAGQSIPVHPTQLYESCFGLVSLVLLILLERQKVFDGQVFLTGVTWYSVYRFLSESLRADAGGWRLLGVLTFAQAISLALGIAAAVLLLLPSLRAIRHQA